MSTIPLHPKRGIDPHLTFCRRCGGDANELTVGAITVAHVPGKPEQFITAWNTGQGQQVRRDLDKHYIAFETRDAKDGEKLPASEPCDKCKAEIEEHRQIVAEGGVYFKCKCCPATGVLRGTSLLAQHVRETTGIAAPNPVGIEFEACEQHQVTPEKG